MDYKEALHDIFNGNGPNSLRIIFDKDSNQWQNVTTSKKVEYLEKMLLSDYSLDFWVNGYVQQFQHTHRHILDAINPSLAFLSNHIKDSAVKNEIESWLSQPENSSQKHNPIIQKNINFKQNKMNKKEINSNLLNACTNLLNFEPNERYNFQYTNLPFCVIDSVFSIGVKYESVENVVENVSKFIKIERFAKDKMISEQSGQFSINDFLNLTEHLSTEELVEKVFKNKQRTSTSNGILKVEACIQFMQILKKHNVIYLQDLPSAFYNKELEREIKSIKGQASGISLKYFYMLGGLEDLIKPDRMIMRFLTEQTGKSFTLDEAQEELLLVAKELSKNLNRKISAAFLDNKIWEYQRNQK